VNSHPRDGIGVEYVKIEVILSSFSFYEARG